MEKIELLAPAGDNDSLHAAVENGADAVYLGGRLFNARQSAGNFDPGQLKAAAEYAHIRGVKVYLTLNTLVADNEFEAALEFARESYLAGIDGVIVQDIGLAGMLHKAMPDLPLHGSTQMTIYDADGAKQLEKLGFKRVVLAREVPSEEIRNIVRNTSLDVEIFVHGALCVCYSGQCLMSSIIGGRSGNRGRCAQPCRLPYELAEKNGAEDRSKRRDSKPQYLLSPKDLCLLGNLNEIADIGVKSLKIEGRMKSPEYVADVVGIYRKYLDRLNGKNSHDGTGMGCKIEACDLHDLMQVFNRGGFSEGYFHGKTGRDMMCFEKPKNWGTYLGKVISYNETAGTVRLKLDESLSMGDGIEIWNGENESPGTVVSLLRGSDGNITMAAAGSIAEVGYVRGRIAKDCVVYKTSDKGLNIRLNESWNGKVHKSIPVDGKATVVKGSPIWLEVRDGNGNVARADGTLLPQIAVNRALTYERLDEQLRKTGNTPFEFKKLDIELEDGLAVPVSEINEVRRQALADIEQMRASVYLGERSSATAAEVYNKEMEKVSSKLAEGAFAGSSRANMHEEPKDISLYFYKWDKAIKYESFGADRVYLPYRCILDPAGESVIKACKFTGQEVYIQLPEITRGNNPDILKKAVEKAGPWQADGFLAGNMGTIHFLKENTGLKIFGDHGLNIFNSFSAEEAAHLGLEGVTLSAELTLEQINSLRKPHSLAFESAVYGRLPLMISEYCPVGAREGGHSKVEKCSGSCSKGEYYLRDRKGIEFPVFCDSLNCRARILNSNVLFIPDILQRLSLKRAGSMRLYIWDEEPGRVKKLVELHREMSEQTTTVKQKYEELITQIKAKGFTKGHFFRGV